MEPFTSEVCETMAAARRLPGANEMNQFGKYQIAIMLALAALARQTVLLNGTWQIAEGSMTNVPATFDRTVPAAKIAQTSDASGVTFDSVVTAAGPLPYGFAFWGDYTGQTISVSSPAGTKVLDGELAYVGVVLKPGENHF